MSILNDLDISKLVETTKNKIKRIYLQDNIPWIIGYSGGKDSTCATQIIIDTLLELKKEKSKLSKKVYIISSDTMVETPMIINTIERTINGINSLAKKNNLPIEASIVRPDYDRGFWANLIGRGYPCPNQTFRWCTDRMKIEPANKFTESVIGEYGEAVMILGVREGESNSRDRVLENHTIEGKDFMRHTTQANSYVFAPIRQFTKDDVWNYLLSNKSPWGGDNEELFKLYSDSLSGEECPIMMSEEDKKKTTCGNSRFGCWVCTVVSEDKSLTGFIRNGIAWLKPLLGYRNWLYSIRDDEDKRMKRRANGSIYFCKINKLENGDLVISAKGNRSKNIIKNLNGEWVDSFGTKWNVFVGDKSEEEARDYIVKNNIDLTLGENPKIIIKKVDEEFYQLGLGPFTLETRKEMLTKLLMTQANLEHPHQLIKQEELVEIQKLWKESGDLENSVEKIYKKFYNDDFSISSDDITVFSNDDLKILNDICLEKDFDAKLFMELLNIEKDFAGYSSRVEAQRAIKNKLSQEYLALREKGETNEDKYY